MWRNMSPAKTGNRNIPFAFSFHNPPFRTYATFCVSGSRPVAVRWFAIVVRRPFSGTAPVPNRNGKPEIAWNVTQWIEFVNTVQETALQYGNSSVPIIYGLDSVHGAHHSIASFSMSAPRPHSLTLPGHRVSCCVQSPAKGANYVRGAVMFPHNIGLAAAWEPHLVYLGAKVTAKDTRYH